MLAKHLNDAGDGRVSVGRLLNNFGQNNLSVFGRAWFANQHLVTDAFVIRLQHRDTTIHHQPPYDGFICALEHLDNGAFRTATSVSTNDMHHHSVTMQNRTHLLGVKKNIIAAIFID